MPGRNKTPCSKPGCPELVKVGQTYCEKHRKERHKRYDKRKRDKKKSKFYSSGRWRKLRNKKLKTDPLCEYCLEDDIVTEATEVDHIIPIDARWDLRLSWDNLKSACHSCHMKKTREDKKKYSD